MDKASPNLRPAMFSYRIHDIQAVARANGYAIAIHGSMQRDLDVIAAPWTDNATSGSRLVEELCRALELTIGSGPSQKPHGREVWTLLMREAGFMDLSIMPVQTTTASSADQ